MTPVDQQTLGEEIRQRREALKLSREGLAYKAGVAHKTIERIEAGLVTPRRATLAMIEMALAAEQERMAA
jgi:predicted transcriptional regulator